MAVVKDGINLGVSVGKGLPGIVGAGVGAVDAIVRQNKADRALKKLGNINYTPTGDLIDIRNTAKAEIANPTGLSAGEKSAYLNNISGMNLVNFNRLFTAGGGNFGRTLSFLTQTPDAYNKLAEMEGVRKFQNQQTAYGRYMNTANTFQNIDNANTGLKLGMAQNYGLASNQARQERDLYGAKYGKDSTSLLGMFLGAISGNPTGITNALKTNKTEVAPVGSQSIMSTEPDAFSKDYYR